jgi:histidyl-tRNA synthetase
MSDKLSTDSYKGVRDFYPEDQSIQDYIFFVWESTLEQFGYEKYNASVLEPTELYRAKSGEEIVNEQTYQFIDRGDREVTLRPEMTPTVARLIAKKRRELIFPVRWYSIPNLFRYERPQRGRLREHWQLNADIFGVHNIEADIEMIEIASALLQRFGLNDAQYTIKINDLRALAETLEQAGLSTIEAHQYRKLLDKKEKIDDFDEQVTALLGRPFTLNLQPSEAITAMLDKLAQRGISNVQFVPSMVRGFDYYTGVVFEVFSTDPKNNRSLFGGGRYDNLTSLFEDTPIPAVGFGMGDVTIRDVLETYNLLPPHESTTQLALCVLNDAFYDLAGELAQELRIEGTNVVVDFSGKKLNEQITRADKRKIPFIICLGENELATDTYKLKELKTGKEKVLRRRAIAPFVKKTLSR